MILVSKFTHHRLNMKSSLMLKSLLFVAAMDLFSGSEPLFAALQTPHDLAANFAQPPPSARPWVFWT